MRIKSGLAAGTLVGIALASSAPGTLAQENVRWMPFVGCWEPTGESAVDDSLLCVVPTAGSSAVEMQTWVEGEMVASERIVADGSRNILDRDKCNDADVANFSESGNRLYLNTEHLCDGTSVGTTSALLAMVSPSEWVDIQVVEAEGARSVGVIRYAAVSSERAAEVGHGSLASERSGAVRSARVGASRAPGPDDLIEATRMTSPVAVEAWLLEHGDPLDLDADALVYLSENDVPESVIDMAIAVSYPETFAVQVTPEGDVNTSTRSDGPRARGVYGRRGFCGPFGCSSYGYGPFYRPGYYGSSYGAGYGYGSGLYGYGYWGYSPRIIVVNGSPNVGSRGRVVRGRGYTRGTSSGGGSGSVTRGDSGGSSVSSGSSGTRRSTGRKAKRRGGD